MYYIRLLKDADRNAVCHFENKLHNHIRKFRYFIVDKSDLANTCPFVRFQARLAKMAFRIQQPYNEIIEKPLPNHVSQPNLRNGSLIKTQQHWMVSNFEISLMVLNCYLSVKFFIFHWQMQVFTPRQLRKMVANFFLVSALKIACCLTPTPRCELCSAPL